MDWPMILDYSKEDCEHMLRELGEYLEYLVANSDVRPVAWRLLFSSFYDVLLIIIILFFYVFSLKKYYCRINSLRGHGVRIPCAG